MRLLVKQDAVQWLVDRGQPTQTIRVSGTYGKRLAVTAAIGDVEASRTYPIARGLGDWLSRTQPEETVVLIIELGIWPSSENPRLYNLLTRASGHTGSSITQRPGHLFHKNERDDLVTLLQLAMIAGWGIVAAADHYHGFTLDHDGHVCFLDHDKAGLDQAVRVVA
jgi:hypothetical protein